MQNGEASANIVRIWNCQNAMKVFREVSPPKVAGHKLVGHFSYWYTWSNEFRNFLKQWEDSLEKIPEPHLIHLGPGRNYNETFDLNPWEIQESSLRDGIIAAAHALYLLPTPRKIILLTDLFFDKFDGQCLHRLFGIFRSVLANLSGNPRVAMSTPLGLTGSYAINFPLHADLYLGEILFNVFNEVSVDNSGVSIFLQKREFLRLIWQTSKVPVPIKKRLTRVFNAPLEEDTFDEVYSLLHGSWHSWVTNLKRAMEQKKIWIHLKAGQGYIIHGRAWLHGRDTPSNGVSSKRLSRLILNNQSLDLRNIAIQKKIVKELQ